MNLSHLPPITSTSTTSDAKAELEYHIQLKEDEHRHHSDRAPWLRAATLGSMDGTISVAALLLGVGGGTKDRHALVLLRDLSTWHLVNFFCTTASAYTRLYSGFLGGILAQSIGEYVSVSTQRDTEKADVELEIREQEKGSEARAHELQELIEIYKARGLSTPLAEQVARELTEKDVIRAHARDELGINIDSYSNPWTASAASFSAYCVGGGIPLISAAFISEETMRLITIIVVATASMIICGSCASILGGTQPAKGIFRVLIGGWFALGVTFGIGYAFGEVFEI